MPNFHSELEYKKFLTLCYIKQDIQIHIIKVALAEHLKDHLVQNFIMQVAAKPDHLAHRKTLSANKKHFFHKCLT